MGFPCRHAILFSVLIIFVCSCFEFSSAKDTITSSQYIKDPETISSSGSFFTLGFFSPENSTNRYVGIWLRSKSNVVWVANRDQPLRDSSGVATISKDGNLVVLNGSNHIIWSSNVSNIASNSTCQLLDSGNLVLLDNSAENTLWQSFQHPSDTFLTTMKISSNKRTGEKMRLISWKSPFDPATGNFYMSLEPQNLPAVFIWNGTRPYWRSDPSLAKYQNGLSTIDDGSGTVYVSYTAADKFEATLTYALNSEGKILEKQWDGAEKLWQVTTPFQNSDCDVYGKCGAFGICNSEASPICNCFRGFEPTNKGEWNGQEWNNGCVRKTTLQCETGKNGTADGNDGFWKLQMVKVPDFAELSSASEDDCKSQCLGNCTCLAYSYVSEIGCMHWRENLIDTEQFTIGGLDLYIRLAYSDLGNQRDVRKIIIITITAVIGTIIIVFGAYLLWNRIVKYSVRRRKSKWCVLFNRGDADAEQITSNIIGEPSEIKLQETLVYDFDEIVVATNNFHLSQKLGQGGFGSVYKGKLQDGQDIAVKRLSRASGQGLEEFTNEVVVISKLQHRNLVRLLGYCTEGEEKMLIYEYMPNKSLDAFIFDPPNDKLLDWRTRFDIIKGVARGILYLHSDSRLKIIHRDLKASNILLDENLTPKISDFGMARIFQGTYDQAKTIRVVGTYGYMSPEYAIEGRFSEKSDVYSFGVLLLEIISGIRNSNFHNEEFDLNLLRYAWKLWNEKNIVPFIDPEIYTPDFEKDILRCLHIGLLCVQDLARMRPSMSTVISMLSSEMVNFPPPRQPIFIPRQSMLSSASHEERDGLYFSNNASVTELQGR